LATQVVTTPKVLALEGGGYESQVLGDFAGRNRECVIVVGGTVLRAVALQQCKS